MDSRTRAVVAAGAFALVGVAALLGALLVRRSHEQDTLGPDGVVDQGHMRRRGDIRDRGKGGKFAIDLERLSTRREEFEPTVEYLTYIQSRRGDDDGSILFVRHEDVDAIAALEGSQPDEFVERLKQLGVVISIN